MAWLLIPVSLAAVFYMIRYYMLADNLRKAQRQLKEIRQNPDQNRILLFSHPGREAESLFLCMNDYILFSGKQRREYAAREKKLRAQIENISHDLRTPLTAVLGYLELIEQDGLSREDREALLVVERKAKSLQRLIGNFYDLSRLEMEDYRIHRKPLELTRFTRETMLLHFQEFENRHLMVDLHLGERPVFVMADTDAMEQIFENLIQNGLRYAGSCFQVSVGQGGGGVEVIFENDTEKLTPREAEHIFDRFYVRDASRTGQSTGLGLTISRLLARAMGGEAKARMENNMLRLIFTFQRAEVDRCGEGEEDDKNSDDCV